MGLPTRILSVRRSHSSLVSLIPTGNNGTPCYTNWAIECLPFMEQQALYTRYNQSLLNTDAANYAAVGNVRVATYECPSDTLLGRSDAPASGPDTSRTWAHGSYRAVSGKIQYAVSYGCWDTFEPGNWPGSQRASSVSSRPMSVTPSSLSNWA